MPTLYLDLDGTLVDVRRKHYAAYVATVCELGSSPISAHEYWQRRRDGASNGALLRDTGLERWVERVESPSYVRLDTPIPGARAALVALREDYELVLVTMRHDRAALLEQLDGLSLRSSFSAVYCRDGQKSGAGKAGLVRDHAGVVLGSAVVGDSEADVEAARTLGVESICVTSGVRSRRYLSALTPDRLIESVAQLPEALALRQPTNA